MIQLRSELLRAPIVSIILTLYWIRLEHVLLLKLLLNELMRSGLDHLECLRHGHHRTLKTLSGLDCSRADILLLAGHRDIHLRKHAPEKANYHTSPACS